MSIKYSEDNGAAAINRSRELSLKSFDYPFFIVDLCEAIKNKTILVIRNTSNENVVNGTIDTRYLVKDFEIIPNEELGDSFQFKLQQEDKKEIEIFNLKNVKKIEQNIGRKYYITSDNLKDDVLGFIFK
ncbi:hypothetical protein [Clostridium sp. Marseille-QA1073]